MVWLALAYPSRTLFGACLITAFLSDVFDGILARRLGVATPALRRLDSIADTIFYVAAIFAAWYLHPDAIREYRGAFAVLIALELLRYVFDYLKFRREAAYHMWSSKLWGIALFAAFFVLLAMDVSGWPIALAIYLGILADLEGLAISVVLPVWRADVPTLVHALRIRSAAPR